MSFVLDPPLTPTLRAEIVALWTDVTNAGGAVGFAGQVSRADVAALAAPAFAAVEQGHDHLVTGYVDGRVAGMLFLVGQRFALAEHWRTVKRLMVHPALQGNGYGTALLQEAETVARRFGWAALHLTVRGGTGTERLYLAHGYRLVGRYPRALRVAPDDDRDELHLWKELR
jgi:GNAT superfamily N-acetyltransferase